MTTRAAVLAQLASGPQTAREVAARTGLPHGAVATVLSLLKSAGMVQHDGWGCPYRLAETTEAMLARVGAEMARLRRENAELRAELAQARGVTK